MPIVSFLEENSPTFVFVGGIFLAIILVGIVLVLKLPVHIEQALTQAASFTVGISILYFIVQGIRSMWTDPEAETWEWFMYFGLFLGLVFGLALLALGYEAPIDMTGLFDNR